MKLLKKRDNHKSFINQLIKEEKNNIINNEINYYLLKLKLIHFQDWFIIKVCMHENTH